MKAAYTATAAAAVLAAGIGVLGPRFPDYLAAIPVLCAVITIILATRAIKPLSLSVVDARKMTNRYMQSPVPQDELGNHLLEIRVVEIEKRDELNQARAGDMKRGFRWLTASFATLLFCALLSGVWPMEMGTDGEARETQTATPTPAP